MEPDQLGDLIDRLASALELYARQWCDTPEDVVQACVERLCSLNGYRVEEFRLVEERVMFPLPGEILSAARERGVAIGAGNERAAARAAGEFKIRHH